MQTHPLSLEGIPDALGPIPKLFALAHAKPRVTDCTHPQKISSRTQNAIQLKSAHFETLQKFVHICHELGHSGTKWTEKSEKSQKKHLPTQNFQFEPQNSVHFCHAPSKPALGALHNSLPKKSGTFPDFPYY